MRENFFRFVSKRLKKFIDFSIDLFIFLPYFFSVTALLKSLFYPWKNLVYTQKTKAFSFPDLLEKISFNLTSRLIGFTCRISVICFYLIIQFFYVILLPIIFLIYILILPLFYLIYIFGKTEDEKREIARKKFIENHLLEQNNYPLVNEWFESSYSKKNDFDLLSYPPLARDWAVGYTPIIDDYCDELTAADYQAKITTAFDREKEIDQIEKILSKSAQANVVIVGEEGVGKHTIVDTLAKKIYEGKTTTILAYKRILSLNMEKILNKYTDQKQRENFVEELLKEAGLAKNIILLIENFDRYTCSGGERIDLTIPFEKYGKTCFLQIIGITEPFLYHKFVYPNDKINRIFEKVDVYEIKKEDALKIILEKSLIFEEKYKLLIPYETITTIIEKSAFFISDIPFPEKALELLDLACVSAQKDKKKVVDPQLINKVISEKTHVPTNLTEQIRTKLINLEALLFSRILQQEEAIKKLSSAIRRSFLLLGKRKKPMGSFLFLGPTGVGKTQTAKSLADIFFGSEKYLIRFDMSNFQSKEDIPNILEQLTIAIRQNPYGVLLLDEIEKANRDLINIFLTLLDEGYFVNQKGEKIDCKNLVVIATSNAQGDVNTLIENKVFAPEFLNRFDGIITFQTLSQQSIRDLTKKYLDKIVNDIYALYKVHVVISPNYIDRLATKGYDPRFGARNLERVIREEVEDRIAKLILEKKVKEEDNITL